MGLVRPSEPSPAWLAPSPGTSQQVPFELVTSLAPEAKAASVSLHTVASPSAKAQRTYSWEKVPREGRQKEDRRTALRFQKTVPQEAAPQEAAPQEAAPQEAASQAAVSRETDRPEGTRGAGGTGGVETPSTDARSVVEGGTGVGEGLAKEGRTAMAPAVLLLHHRLESAVRRCYPPTASRFRLTGRVILSFCLDTAGTATSVAPVSGSGFPLLDRAAVDCVLPGALPVPDAAGCYRVPVVFGAP